MTTADMFNLIRRRWLLVLVGFFLTVLAVLHVRDAKPVYWTQAEVQIVAPSGGARTNLLTVSSQSLISMAALVAHSVQDSDPPGVSDRVNLPDLGVRDGWQVRLPNTGSQWEPQFDRPIIDIQVVAPTAEAAEQRLAELVGQVTGQLATLQAADGVRPGGRMTATVLPGRNHAVMLVGGPARAATATLVIGLWLTMTATLAAGTIGGAVVETWATLVRGRRRWLARVLVES